MFFCARESVVTKYAHALYLAGDDAPDVVYWEGPGWYAAESRYSTGDWWIEYRCVGTDPSTQPDTFGSGLSAAYWYSGYNVES